MSRPIKVLANANQVIELLQDGESKTPAEIAERIGMPRPSVYRLLDGLSAIGLTETLPDSTARLSIRWLHLADRASEAMSEWSGADAVLADLVERTKQTAFLSVPRGDEAVCVRWQQGRGIDILLLKPGRALPMYAGAAGRMMLAGIPDLQAYLARSDRRPYTEFTLTSEEALLQDAEATRARGYAVSDQDVTLGIGALGASVRRGQATGFISIAGLAEPLRSEREALARELLAAAATLGQ